MEKCLWWGTLQSTSSFRMRDPAFEKPQSSWNVLSHMHEGGRNKAATLNLLAAASHFEKKNTRVPIIKTPQKIHYSRRRCCTLPCQLNAKKTQKKTRLSVWNYYLISLGGSPAVVSCTCWWVHGPMKQEAKPTDIHLEPTEQSTLICVSLAPVLPFSPSSSSFPSTARAHTHSDTHRDTQTRACRRSANIHQNSRALRLINSAQIGKSHVDGALALVAIATWHGMKTTPTCWDRAV